MSPLLYFKCAFNHFGNFGGFWIFFCLLYFWFMGYAQLKVSGWQLTPLYLWTRATKYSNFQNLINHLLVVSIKNTFIKNKSIPFTRLWFVCFMRTCAASVRACVLFMGFHCQFMLSNGTIQTLGFAHIQIRI